MPISSSRTNASGSWSAAGALKDQEREALERRIASHTDAIVAQEATLDLIDRELGSVEAFLAQLKADQAAVLARAQADETGVRHAADVEG